METKVDIITYILKIFFMNILVYYSFIKISNLKFNNIKVNVIVILFNVALSILGSYVYVKLDSILSLFIVFFLYGLILSKATKNNLGYSMIITILSYSISIILYGFSVIVSFIPYTIFKILNDYINCLVITVIHFLLIYYFFKIKKFRNGFDFLISKIDNDFIDILVINISVDIVSLYSIIGTTVSNNVTQIRKKLIFAFITLCFIMIISIQKSLKMYYKQKLLNNTMKEYEKELKEKDAKIEELTNEKFNISKITHKFYNRQKALELLVKQTSIMKSEISEEFVSKKVLDMVKSLTDEYTKEFDKIKNLSKLEETGIPELDSIFKYMQSECKENNIEFKLKIIGNIYPLINNIIAKNKLETLIGDHIRDAINAVKSSNKENKEIFVILGIKENKYELTIYDTGIEFQIDTLLKLGKEAVTTYKGKGGSGIGFLTTFETMDETKASLIIKEEKPNSHYTKSVTIRFDCEHKYKICSYRAKEIKKNNKDERIVIEEIQM